MNHIEAVTKSVESFCAIHLATPNVLVMSGVFHEQLAEELDAQMGERYSVGFPNCLLRFAQVCEYKGMRARIDRSLPFDQSIHYVMREKYNG